MPLGLIAESSKSQQKSNVKYLETCVTWKSIVASIKIPLIYLSIQPNTNQEGGE